MRARNPPSGPIINLQTSPGQTTPTVVASAVTIDWSNGPNQKLVLNAAPVNVTSIGLPEGETASLTLEVQQDATGNRTIAFVGGLKASPFVLSTAANAIDMLDLFWDGSVVLASIRAKAYA